MLNHQYQTWEEPRLSRQDFKALFEATNQAMFVEDRDGSIISLNQPACDLWGSSMNAIVGKHASEVLPPKLGTCSIGTVRRSRYTRPDGTTIEVEVLSTPLTIGEDEAFLTTVWLAEDNEDLPESPIEAQEAPQPAVGTGLDDKMEALERLSERVSTDFNNTLTSIAGYASLMREDPALSERNRDYLKSIVEASHQAEQLSRELLTFGKTPEVPDTHFDPAGSISKADPLIREELGSKIALTTILEQDVPPIPGSEDTLSRILVQLARNTRQAIGACSAEGTMKIELGSNEDRSATIVRVSDDGPGMDATTAAAAFEPFYSSHPNTTARGLGLSKVYAATRNLGGTVSLESIPNEGTRLTFCFPAARPQEPSSPTPGLQPLLGDVPKLANSDPASAAPTAGTEAPSGAPARDSGAPQSQRAQAPQPATASKRSPLPGGTEHILVVEDEPMVREIVVRSLEHLGYTVHKACDGQEGLELSRELDDEIDLIFSDIVMPRLSGPEMIQKMRAEDRNTPVLFTTGFTESKHLLENGGDLREGIDLLHKPYTPNVLAERVREKLDSLIN